jgi:uncharacterized protein involved in exopolysaccharide biosynthesis
LPGPQTEPRRIGEPDIVGRPPEGDDLVGLLNVLLRNRRLVLWIPLAAAVVVMALTMLKPRLYRSEAAFTPQQSQRMPSAFSGLAAQFGVQLPSDRLDQSPAFYEDLLLSREILSRVVATPFDPAVHGGERAATLIELYEIDDGQANARVDKAVRQLRNSIRKGTDQETGIVRFSVPAERPELAQAMAERAIAEINEFNLTRRQSIAGAERAFVESSLKRATDELASAESQLRLFDERNLRIDNSPELRLERDRLQRQVGMRQEVVTMLTQAYEQAKIDEVRNTPAITVIERPSLPWRPEPRGSVQNALLAFIVLSFTGTLLAFGRELYRRLGFGDSLAHQEFRTLRGGLRPRWLRAKGR